MGGSRRYRGLAGAGIAIALVGFCFTEAFPQVAQPSSVVPNAAGVSIEIFPGARLQAGTKAQLRVTTKKMGYLIVVNVDAVGKVKQIFPNADYVLTEGASPLANQIKPAQVITIPEPGNPYTGFAFIVPPPSGAAMSVAILCDQPVQFVDLPDVPSSMRGGVAAVKYLADATNSLRIVAVNVRARLAKPKWSFAAVFYQVE
jgi:hypothetical protein